MDEEAYGAGPVEVHSRDAYSGTLEEAVLHNTNQVRGSSQPVRDTPSARPGVLCACFRLGALLCVRMCMCAYDVCTLCIYHT